GSPLGDLAIVESPQVPFRHAPGLSLAAVGEPPPQLGVFTDADGFTAITAFDGRLPPLAHLDFTTSALPFRLLDRPEVLVLGAGGGSDVLQALYADAVRIDAVELDPLMVRLVREVHGGFAGGLYDLPQVRVHIGEARGFVAQADRQWDLIQIPLLDSFAAAASGVHGLSESFIYTVEAMQRYLRRLRPGGYLAITRWLKLPPRDSLKLFATALDALTREGVTDPAARLALVRSWSTTTLLVKNGAITPMDIEIMRAFANERSFDLAFYSGMPESEANRTNVLDAPYFYAGATALAGAERADFVARYKFDIRPATDDRPYFFDFFRWRAQIELLGSSTVGVASLLEWSYPILVATLVQTLALSLVLILLPLALRRRGEAHPDRWRIAGYFVAIGIAFLFVEIAFIQRFVLFLHNPLYAVAVVIAGFLVFAGLGSACAPDFAAWLERRRTRVSALEIAVGAIGLIALIYLVVLPPLFDAFIALPQSVKVALSLVFIAPLGFWMGMPFPLVLARVKARAPSLVPWAWAVSGCASVLSVILATLLAMQFGFLVVVSVAIVAYAFAALLMRAPIYNLNSHFCSPIQC
ncbi:MAG: SAM-dependent methyltransferase, partial [Alphaproteobacteria bacterium]|nr:SAM-dependent methyltransferase [Alphaproteobacteria bacterium]